jgi:hypothetical protein
LGCVLALGVGTLLCLALFPSSGAVSTSSSVVSSSDMALFFPFVFTCFDGPTSGDNLLLVLLLSLVSSFAKNPENLNGISLANFLSLQ